MSVRTYETRANHIAPVRSATLGFSYRPDALPAGQPTVSKHWWRKSNRNQKILFLPTHCIYILFEDIEDEKRFTLYRWL